MPINALSVASLFGTSALYHRIDWRTVAARRWMRRLDHTMIFVLIAGTYTPFALITLRGTLGGVILVAVWSAALAGAVFKLLWIDAPGWLIAASYIAVGWIVVVAMPELVTRLGVVAVSAQALGGVLYSVGAVSMRSSVQIRCLRFRIPRDLPPARTHRRCPALRSRGVLGPLILAPPGAGAQGVGSTCALMRRRRW